MPPARPLLTPEELEMLLALPEADEMRANVREKWDEEEETT